LKYVALLRGINVSGRNAIKMKDLQSAFEKLGFKNVVTFIQSGNVVFDYDSIQNDKITQIIENEIAKKFKLDIKVIIRTKEELEAIAKNNPILQKPGIDAEKLHVTFLYDKPDSDVSQLIFKKEENEEYIIRDREIYLYCPNGYGNTKLTNSVFEKKLKTFATTRNFKTVNKLLEL